MYLTAFTASAKLDTVFFHGIPMTNGSRAWFTYNTADPLESIIIALRERPGDEIQEIPPTAILGPTESADYIPPTTTIDINSDNVAFVSVTDNPGGSGILRTYCTTDLRTFSVYREPFTVSPDAKIVMAFSVDRNPWLFVEPREGITPALITLSVRVLDLEPGIYRGTVIVRSRTTGTVFAERVIEVVLELSDESSGGPGVPPIQ